MKRFMVLLEKQYVIGRYVPVNAESAEVARNQSIAALEEAPDTPEELLVNPDECFEEMEADIDDILEQQGRYKFILNTPSIQDGVLRISEQSRPLMMAEETAVIGA